MVLNMAMAFATRKTLLGKQLGGKSENHIENMTNHIKASPGGGCRRIKIDWKSCAPHESINQS